MEGMIKGTMVEGADETLCMQMDLLDGVKSMLDTALSESNMHLFLKAMIDAHASQKLVLSRAAQGDVATYQVVFVSRTPLTNEPRIMRRFVSFRSIASALRFYLSWKQHQLAADGEQATCLTEWGPSADSGVHRKYILDLDVSTAKLFAYGLTEAAHVCTLEEKVAVDALVVKMGSCVANEMREIGLVLNAPLYGIKTRHVGNERDGYTKLSYHVTLLVMGRYDVLRNAMKYILQCRCPAWVNAMIASHKKSKTEEQDSHKSKTEEQDSHKKSKCSEVSKAEWNRWAALLFNDAAVTNHVSGQPMQTLGSQKVAFPTLANASRFAFYGLFRSDGESEWPTYTASRNEVVQFLVTSMSMPDPYMAIARSTWISPMLTPSAPRKRAACLLQSPDCETPGVHGKRVACLLQSPGVHGKLQSLDCDNRIVLPMEWMRDLLMRPNGESRVNDFCDNALTRTIDDPTVLNDFHIGGFMGAAAGVHFLLCGLYVTDPWLVCLIFGGRLLLVYGLVVGAFGLCMRWFS